MEHLMADLGVGLSGQFEVVTGPAGVPVVVPKGSKPFAGLAAPVAPAAAAGGSGSAGGDERRAGPSTAPSAAAAAAATKQYKKSTLALEQRFALMRSVGEECIQEEELMNMLKVKDHPVCYDGFEPSGRMHIAQGILKAINVNKLTRAGCVFKFWVADWFALLNNKMGGDLKKIRTVGQYMIEVWRAAGMDMDNVEFLWASDEINGRSNEYWLRVMDIARRFNVPRIVRCCTIMGRSEQDDLSAAQIFYPCMQCADIFFLKADICQLGMDQRKVNMLAREYCEVAEPKIKFKPVVLSHHMMLGLKEGQEKMSKSDPDSAVFMEDSAADVTRKIKRAYCPPGIVEKNPCLDMIKHVVYGKLQEAGWTVKRRAEDGGDVHYPTYESLEADYVAGKLHPGDVKANLIEALNGFLEPIRKHFASGEPKKLLEQVNKFKITR